jgi:Ca-activated chloride channel homolog
MKAVAVGLLSIAAAATGLRSPFQVQQQAAPIERRDGQTATIHVESRLVNVAVNVVDAHGAPVAGLKADDFEISEDGKPQKIAVFEKESTTPLQMVLAIDASESVFNDEHLEKEAAKKFVRSLLRPQDSVEVMSFADDVTELVSFTNDMRRVENGFGRLDHGDATALYDAIYLAGQRMTEVPAKPEQRRVVVLITDGENTTHHGSYDAALEQVQRAGAMVYALIIVPVAADAGRNVGGEHALIQMANDTGGKYYYVESKRDLAPAFTHLSDDLRTQYSLGYYAPQQGGDRTGLRRIHVELKDAQQAGHSTLRYRTAYYGNK